MGTFKDIMDEEYPNAWSDGLSALKDDGHGNDYTKRIKPSDKCLLEGSFYIEDYYKKRCRSAYQETYWDYAIGYDSNVYFVEIHEATTHGLDAVLAKYRWLSQNVEPKFAGIKNATFYVSTGKPQFTKQSNYQRKLSSNGIKFRDRFLELPPTWGTLN